MGIATGPHYEVASADLAHWLEVRGKRTWWLVDGDPVLTSRLTFPCPSTKLIPVLRTIDRPLLIADRQNRADARGQVIGWQQLDEQVWSLGDAIYRRHSEDAEPEWAANRLFWLCWKNAPDDAWMLEEDRETAQAFEEDPVAPVSRD